jgi:hypothetical protein
MPAVKNVGEPCAGEPHARFEVAAGGNQTSRASTRRAVQAPLADPTKTPELGLGGSTSRAKPLQQQSDRIQAQSSLALSRDFIRGK